MARYDTSTATEDIKANSELRLPRSIDSAPHTQQPIRTCIVIVELSRFGAATSKAGEVRITPTLPTVVLGFMEILRLVLKFG